MGRDLEGTRYKHKWVTASGEILRIEDMTVEHIQNCMSNHNHGIDVLADFERELARRRWEAIQRYRQSCPFCGGSMRFTEVADPFPDVGWSASETRLFCESCECWGPPETKQSVVRICGADF